MTCGNNYESVVSAGGILEKLSAKIWGKVTQGLGELSKS